MLAQLEPVRGRKRRIQELQEHGLVCVSVCLCVHVCMHVCMHVCVCIGGGQWHTQVTADARSHSMGTLLVNPVDLLTCGLLQKGRDHSLPFMMRTFCVCVMGFKWESASP